MEYKGYIGRVKFDETADIFHGEIINLRDVVTFQGETVGRLRRAFKDSVEDYLEFCAARGEAPEKPYSGKFMVRLDPRLHQAISACAKMEGKSLNVWVSENLEQAAKYRARAGEGNL